MIRILIDADLIIEALLNRNGLVGDINQLFDRVNPFLQFFVTDIGWQKIYTCISCLQNSCATPIIMDWLREKIQICKIDKMIVQQARNNPIQDFESAIEFICATGKKFDAIVTHHGENFNPITHQLRIWSVEDLWIRANLETQFQKLTSNQIPTYLSS
ncbi:hypothetical protein [Calothrix sp. NIES-3974]|uniref:hypothetical protein n=1 Tax=Calothrix sp. NIES-3974 TaxID=2005462 RepID=UPI000B6116E6|nr:hypothetical protein [Calothrix sp. NIES-3974]BAZ05909.1 hypothetical protein NIES3974_25650 [Calothrix sp. NIES-3974]